MKRQTSFYAKEDSIQKEWILVDADSEILGKLAAKVAMILRGKHKPTFTPSMDTGDFVVVTNAEKIRVTGKKQTQKRYYRHSHYPGGLKSRTFDEQIAKDPTVVIMHAIKGMLPTTKMGRKLLTHVKVYAGSEHPHEAQNPRKLG